MSYDRIPASEHARNLLASRLAAVRREIGSHDALRQEEARLRVEIEGLERDPYVREARDPARLPTGATVSVASPCKERWDGMVGDERVRHCSRCDKNVYNLSGMTAEEVVALVEAREGDICVRYFKRADGTMITSDCPVGRPTKIALGGLTAAGIALAAGGAAVGAVMAARAVPAACETATQVVDPRTPANATLTPPPAHFRRHDDRMVMGAPPARFDDGASVGNGSGAIPTWADETGSSRSRR